MIGRGSDELHEMDTRVSASQPWDCLGLGGHMVGREATMRHQKQEGQRMEDPDKL